MADVTVIGGGLAGCEAAWQLAEAGFSVQLLEMKPVQYTPAHHYEGLAELVCSNSLKADRIRRNAPLIWQNWDGISGKSPDRWRAHPAPGRICAGTLPAAVREPKPDFTLNAWGAPL